MPLTFFAHQAPLLPIVRRWPHGVDGLALMIGSMSPDLAYVLVGTQFEVRSHELPAAIVLCVPVSLVVAWLVARVLAPVVPDHLPRSGPLRSFDLVSYRGLATHRFGFVRSVVWASIGSLSHIGIDQFTHDWGWAARHSAWYGRPIGGAEFSGRGWSPARIAQYVGHVGFSAAALLLLLSYARAGWFRSRAERVEKFRVSRVSTTVLWGMTSLGCVIGLAAGSLGDPAWLVLFMRAMGGTFIGLCLGSFVLRPSSRAQEEQKHLTASIHRASVL
jgi:Domain of unknown function (DUF4184)